MNLGLIYTTNQDNVWEKCCEAYGRNFRKIVKLSDLSEYSPGENLYLKYHGDLDDPDSVIFTKTSYDSRIADHDHFLNIRLKSDILGKSFLFIGYSFRDPNIQILFHQLNQLFRGNIPQSYLVAFSYSPEMEQLNEQYGVKIIDPVKEMNEEDKAVAYNSFLGLLCQEIFKAKTEAEIQEFFSPKQPPSKRIVTKYEIEGVKEKIASSSETPALSLFRATLIPRSIPRNSDEIIIPQ